MTDLTILYYSACRIAPSFAEAIRSRLVASLPAGVPIVSVTHQPVDVGRNICVGDVQQGAWQVYQNALIAARAATTEFVACAEDDSLYCREHWTLRPPVDTFIYNRHRWVLSRRLSADGKRRESFYYFRERTQFAQCIAPRALLIDALEERFAKYPDRIADPVLFKMGWGEPGRYEKNLKLAPRKLAFVRTIEPNVTINHALSIRGRRATKDGDLIATDLAPWGGADALWEATVGR